MRRTLIQKIAAWSLGMSMALAPSLGFTNPVITNGDFEQNPPSAMGNNTGYTILPWTLSINASRSNVVRVDGPGGTTYRSSNLDWIGPESDATAPGAGVMQHYLDIQDNQNTLAQSFTTECSGNVRYGAYFSGRMQDEPGLARVSILDAGGATVAGPATVTVVPSDVQTQPWKFASYTTNLTANTPYQLSIFMDNNMNVDNIFVAFDDCAEHDNPPFDLPDTAEITREKTCEPLVEADDGFLETTCQITVNVEAEGTPTEFTLSDVITVGSTPAASAIQSITSSDPWACTNIPTNVNNASQSCSWSNPPSGSTTSILTATVRLNPTLAAGQSTLTNCANVVVTYEDGQYGPGEQTEESCAELDIPFIPTPPAIEKTCDAPVAGAAVNDYAVACQINVIPSNPAIPGNYLFVEENLFGNDGALNAAAIGSLTASGWVCDPAAAPYAAADKPVCFVEESDLPVSGQLIDVAMNLTAGGDRDWNNCARLTTVSTGDAGEPDAAQLFEAFEEDVEGFDKEMIGQACARIPLPPVVEDPPTPASVEKTCGAPAETGSAGNPIFEVSCQITVIPSSNPLPGQYLFLEEELTAPNGNPNAAAIDALVATGWDCQPAAAPYSDTQVPQCFIDETALPITGQVIDVTMSLYYDNNADWKNCARLARMAIEAGNGETAEQLHDMYATNDLAPEGGEIGESCVDIPLKHPEDPPPPPKGAQCTPFTPDVACDQATGTWVVSLNNAHSGSFDPTDISVSTSAQGISLIPGSDPLNFRVSGANPGDRFTVKTEAVENGAGGGIGLDLCCMGEVEITIPTGEVCEPPESDRDLTVHKTCSPLPFEGGSGENYECTFHVDYSGPPPTPSNPILVSDTLVSGGPMTIMSYDTQVGDAAQWSCANDPNAMPTPGPLNCEMHNGILSGKPDSYWRNFSHTFSLWMIMQEPFSNCADASINDQSGTPITSQSCYSKGDFDLEITKKLADAHGGICRTGQACNFVYEVINTGGDAYAGPITLFDAVTLNGSIPGGDITSISPSSCVPADLSGAGCTETVSLAPGESTIYNIEYMVPVGFGDGIGENCVSLADPSISPEDDLTEVDGHHSCAEFEIIDEDEDQDVDISLAKTVIDGTIDQATFLLTPTLTVGSLSAGDTVTITDDMSAAGLTNVQIDPAAASDGWVCSVNGDVISCSFTATTATTTLPTLAVGGVAPAPWTENCATLTSSVSETDLDNNTDCAASEFANDNTPPKGDEEVDTSTPRSADPEAIVAKTCGPAQQASHQGIPGWTWDCQINVDVLGDLDGANVEISDDFQKGSAAFGTILSLTSSDPQWACSIINGGVTGLCTADDQPDVQGPHSFVSQVFAADINQSGVTGAENCVAGIYPSTTQSCVDLHADGVERPDFEVLKECGTAKQGEHRGITGWKWGCTLSLQILGGEIKEGVSFGDQIDIGSAVFGGIIDFTPVSDAFECSVSDSLLSAECQMPAEELAGHSQHIINAEVFIADVELSGIKDAQNCAVLTGNTPMESCVALNADGDVIDTPKGRAELELVKTSTGACVPNEAAQIYSCGFDLTLRNVGDAAYSGPAVINDTFGTPRPTKAVGEGADWSCFRSDGKGTSCVSGNLALDPGASSSVSMQLTLPGQPNGGSFENCAALGVGESRFQRASIIQTAMQMMGIDGGPVDGSPGRKTRAGVREMQERLGLSPTGEIDDALFGALGVPTAADGSQSCVTVDLPPMKVNCQPGQERNSNGVCFWPKPDCKPGQKINSKGQCYTPSPDCKPGQQLNSKGQCYTPKPDGPKCKAGQKVNSKGKCYWPKPTCEKGQKVNSRGKCYWPEVKCDSRSTVKRNGACVCRYKGMRQISKTRCSCSNGLPVVPGAGCVRIEKKRGGDGPAGETKGKVCITLAGRTVCR